MLAKLVFVILLSTFYDVELVVSSKERKVSDAPLQDVQRCQPSEFHQGGGDDPQEKPVGLPDAGRDSPVKCPAIAR